MANYVGRRGIYQESTAGTYVGRRGIFQDTTAAAGGGGTTGILRQHTNTIAKGYSGVVAAQLGGVLVH